MAARQIPQSEQNRHKVTVAPNDAMYARLQAEAAERDLSVGTVARQLLAEAMEEAGSAPRPRPPAGRKPRAELRQGQAEHDALCLPHLVPTAEPPTQPTCGVPINRHVGRADLPQNEVVCPSGQEPIQAFNYNPWW